MVSNLVDSLANETDKAASSEVQESQTPEVKEKTKPETSKPEQNKEKESKPQGGYSQEFCSNMLSYNEMVETEGPGFNEKLADALAETAKIKSPNQQTWQKMADMYKKILADPTTATKYVTEDSNLLSDWQTAVIEDGKACGLALPNQN